MAHAQPASDWPLVSASERNAVIGRRVDLGKVRAVAGAPLGPLEEREGQPLTSTRPPVLGVPGISNSRLAELRGDGCAWGEDALPSPRSELAFFLHWSV